MGAKEVLSKEPWYVHPPEPGQTDADLEWGYLVFYTDGTFEFINERPSDEEIASRTSCR